MAKEKGRSDSERSGYDQRRPGSRVKARRRLLGGGLVAVVVVIVVLFFVIDGSGDSGAGADQVGQTQEETTDAEPDEDALANPVQCRAGALEVQVELTAGSFDAGESIEIPVTVTNTGDVPCLTDTGHESMTVEVHSGDDLIWSSAECPAGAADRDLLLDIGAGRSHTVTWDGTRATSSCDGEQASAGTYRVDATLSAEGTDAAAEQTFSLD